MIVLSFLRSTPITKKLFDSKFFLNLIKVSLASVFEKFPIVEPGKKPIIVIEPWGIKLKEHQHVFNGNQTKEIRIWGRKRLKILKELLPQATELRVDLLGTGLPSFWCIRTNNINLIIREILMIIILDIYYHKVQHITK